MRATLALAPAWDWLGATGATVGWILLGALLTYVFVIALTRLGGLRSFATMSAFDVAMTVAVGTLVGSTIVSPSVSLASGCTALAALYLLKQAVGWGRLRWPSLREAIDNTPLVLLWEGELLRDNMRSARVAESDVWAKLREAGVARVSRVRAVVLETTGNISVIAGDQPIDERLLANVRGIPGRDGQRARSGARFSG